MRQAQKVTRTIQCALDAANGKRKQRTLSIREVAQVLTEAMHTKKDLAMYSRYGYGYTTGGHVANAYGYSAATTLAFAVANGPDYIALKIGQGDARKNSSPVTFAGPNSVRDSDCRKWAECQTLYTLRDWIILSRAECKLFIRSLSAMPANVLRNLPDVLVTLNDSLAAGNCRAVSERVASWFAPSSEISARTLAKVVQSREPLLIPFALRAIKQAEQRRTA